MYFSKHYLKAFIEQDIRFLTIMMIGMVIIFWCTLWTIVKCLKENSSTIMEQENNSINQMKTTPPPYEDPPSYDIAVQMQY